MDRPLRLLLLAAVLGGGAWAVLRWPHLDTVETGRTPEYPDLRPRDYAASEAEVSRAVKAAVEKLGWQFVGAGRGPGGSEVQATTRGRVLPTDHEVTVRFFRTGPRTRVSVRAHSRTLSWDFGENARLVEAFLPALDEEIARKR
jgi:Protein of unknown function (DUF1499)